MQMRGTDQDWNYSTQQENNACQGMIDKQCKISRGRVLGGTSSINNMHYIKAFPEDFAKWPINEVHGWTREHIDENYRKHEGTKDSNEHYGQSGELKLGMLNDPNDIGDLIYEGASAMGYNKVEPGARIGYMDVLGTIDDGRRLNYAKAFLKDIRNRPNLAVARKAFVTHILTQIPKDRRIQGVKVYVGGKEIEVRAKKEVILSAGAVNTAHLLMLSGFGPKDILKQNNIPIVVDVPVGTNLQDKISTYLFVGIDKGKQSKPNSGVDNTYSYMMHHSGGLTRTAVNDIIGFINTEDKSSTVPNVIIHHHFFEKNDPDLENVLNSFGLHKPIKRSLLEQNQDECFIVFVPTLIKPKSRGKITLDNDSPFKPPYIWGNYLSEHEDQQVLLSAAKYVLALIETEPFKARDAHFLEVDMPACRNYKYCNEPYLACAVKVMSAPRGEMVGTASLKSTTSCCDRVVDEYLLLDGIRHLRIVDAAAIPEEMTGNLESTVAMMAENAAEQIKKCWGKNMKSN